MSERDRHDWEAMLLGFAVGFTVGIVVMAALVWLGIRLVTSG